MWGGDGGVLEKRMGGKKGNTKQICFISKNINK